MICEFFRMHERQIKYISLYRVHLKIESYICCFLYKMQCFFIIGERLGRSSKNIPWELIEKNAQCQASFTCLFPVGVQAFIGIFYVDLETLSDSLIEFSLFHKPFGGHTGHLVFVYQRSKPKLCDFTRLSLPSTEFSKLYSSWKFHILFYPCFNKKSPLIVSNLLINDIAKNANTSNFSPDPFKLSKFLW